MCARHGGEWPEPEWAPWRPRAGLALRAVCGREAEACCRTRRTSHEGGDSARRGREVPWMRLRGRPPGGCGAGWATPRAPGVRGLSQGSAAFTCLPTASSRCSPWGFDGGSVGVFLVFCPHAPALGRGWSPGTGRAVRTWPGAGWFPGVKSADAPGPLGRTRGLGERALSLGASFLSRLPLCALCPGLRCGARPAPGFTRSPRPPVSGGS